MALLTWVIVGLAVLFVVLFTLNIGGLRERLVHRSTAPAIRSLAVLPLANLSGDTSQDFFADGITVELIREVSKIAQLRVVSRTSVMSYKGTHTPLPQIARELKVNALLEGSVARSGNQVRVAVGLYDGMLRSTPGWRTPMLAFLFIRTRVPPRLSPKRRMRQQKLSNSNPLWPRRMLRWRTL
jgi:TolB-like protein